MENIAKQMIKHCGGLPLAVKVLGGLLAEQYTLPEWKRIGENFKSQIIGGTSFNDSNNSSVYYILSLSFEELPSYLKNCFLYLAHFPEDYEIDVEKLSYCWAAEEILKTRYYEDSSIRDVADVYIEHLVSRNMVISKRDINTSRFETVRLHDMMRDMCLAKAIEENFLQIGCIRSSTANYSQSFGSSRRFVAHSPTEIHVEQDITNPKLRSLFIVFSNYTEEYCIVRGLSFKRLQLLRVLDLNRANIERGILPSSVDKLIHLKYLSLKGAVVSHTPSSLRNLKLLIYLNIHVRSVPKVIPNLLMEMRELRYLALPLFWYTQVRRKLKMCNLVNLETLINFSPSSCNLEDLHGMTRLRTLAIYLNDDDSIEKLCASSAGGCRLLENLDITRLRHKRIQDNGIVFEFINLKQLKLTRLYMRRLYIKQQFASHLTSIYFDECTLEKDPMPILEKFLQLKEVYFLRSFCGKKMISSRSGFPKLERLKLRVIGDLEEWIIEEGSMPLLHTLDFSGCENLKNIPYGLRFIFSLRHLKIDEKWKKKVLEGGDDYYKVQHIPSITFI